jgi:hypothetical protein
LLSPRILVACVGLAVGDGAGRADCGGPNLIGLASWRHDELLAAVLEPAGLA